MRKLFRSLMFCFGLPLVITAGWQTREAKAETITLNLPFNGDIQLWGSLSSPGVVLFGLNYGWTIAPEDTWSGNWALYYALVSISGPNIDPPGGVGALVNVAFAGSWCYELGGGPCQYASYHDHSFFVIPTDGLPTTLHISSIVDVQNMSDYTAQLIIALPGGVTTPIPPALALFAGGLGVIGLLARRRKQKES